MATLKLQERGLMARIHTKHWTGQITDRAVSREVTAAKRAADAAGRFVKHTIDKHALVKMANIKTAVLDYHRTNTIPFDDSQGRFLPIENHADYVKYVDRKIEEHRAACKEFVESFPRYVAQARDTLGDLFDERDYPDADTLHLRFVIRSDFWPVPSADHVLAKLSDLETEKIKQRVEQQLRIALQTGLEDLYGRVEKAVGLCSERLSDDGDKAKIFRNSMIGNLREICTVVPKLNIMSDPGLADACQRIESAIRGLEADELRPHSNVYSEPKRKALKDEMDTVMSGIDEHRERMSAYMGGK